jgi:hypothetical protein
MLLYELITLKHPFDGQEQIKDIILNGGRPLIKSQDLLYPTLMLDLMCLCWLDSPTDRPSAESILKYTKSYEFSHLLDVTLLEDYERPPIVLTCLNQEQDEIEELDELTLYNIKRQQSNSNLENDDDDNDDGFLTNEEIEEEDAIDIWIARNSIEEATSQLEILTYENKLNCTSRKYIDVSSNAIEAMCIYNKNQLWCIDSAKSVFVYCCRTFQKITDYYLGYLSKSQVVAMFSLESLLKLLVCTSDGSILLLKVDFLHGISLKSNRFNKSDPLLLLQEPEYQLNDLQLKVNACILLPTRFDKSYDLWMGSENGEIFCFSLKTMKLTASYLHSSSHHYLSNSLLTSRQFEFSASTASSAETMGQESNVTLLKATSTDTFFIWSYVHPGSTVYLWNHVSKKIMSAYNCRKAFEELNFKELANNSSRDFKIIDMNFLNGHLYCGINTGIVLVLKRLTLTPLLMFNAHMHQLHSLCPVTFETYTKKRFNNFNANANKTGINNSNKVVKKTQHMLLSLGRALAPLHEDIYLSSNKYRVDALRKYASCLIICAWNSN